MLPDDIYTALNARRHRRFTTKEWELCVQWKDVSTCWKPLSDTKERAWSRQPSMPLPTRWKTSQLLPGRWERLYGAKIGSSLRLRTRATIKGPTSRSTNGTKYWREALETRNVCVALDVLHDNVTLDVLDVRIRFQSDIGRCGTIYSLRSRRGLFVRGYTWGCQEEEGAIIKGDYVDARVTGERSTELDRHADQSCVGDNATSYMSGLTVPLRSVPS
jgi:hypothetical protein